MTQSSQTERERTNVLRGRFRSADEELWAVLCSRNDHSSLLLVNDSGHVVGALDFGADADRMWEREGKWVWGSALRAVPPAYVQGALEAYGPGSYEDQLPERIDHDGVEQPIEDKGAEIRYWYQDRWQIVISGD